LIWDDDGTREQPTEVVQVEREMRPWLLWLVFPMYGASYKGKERKGKEMKWN
jgi:hypothetical protein